MEGGGLEQGIEDNGELLKECTPCLGMEFESEEAAFQFYNEYGRIAGFSIRRNYHTKSRKDGIMINRKFVCHREGEKDKPDKIVLRPRPETRTKCEAFMYISLNRDSSKWVVKKFDNTHNHQLHLSGCAHMMPSQRKVCETQGVNLEIGNSVGLLLKASHDLISAQSGGREFVGFTREDHKSYLHYGENMVTIKANYREDIVKFQLSSASGIVELKEEVAKRLELELGNFNLKYQDEDQDWVLMACDADLQDCLKFSSSLGNQLIRLLVTDKVTNFGNSRKSCRGLKRKSS